MRILVAVCVTACLTVVLGGTSDAVIYGLKSEDSYNNPSKGQVSGAPTRLFSFAEGGAAFTDIGLVRVSGTGIDADGLALSPSASLFAFQLTEVNDFTGVPRTSRLVSIDPSTAVASVIGSGSWLARDIRGAAFDASGSLWAVDARNDQLLTVNPATGAVVGTPVGLTSGGGAFDLGSTCDIAFLSSGGLYLISGTNIYAVNAVTGSLSLLYTDTGYGYAGAAFSIGAHYGDLFTYEINGADDIYRLDAAFARTTVFANIIPSFNAGRGDLAGPLDASGGGIIPEPLTMLGMFLGLGSVGAYIRRRRSA